jgi:thiol:disulfide interchange protein DsbD
MGLPLLVLGASEGKLLPRAGAWMNAVKALFGVLLLAVAIWLLERIVPGWLNMLLWALLLIVSAMYMGALSQPVNNWLKLWKGLGFVLLTWGVLLLVGLGSGHYDPLQPLKGFGGGGTAVQEEHLAFKRIKTVEDLERELALAAQQDRTVMLDFYADWCISCKEMEKYTFTDPAVQSALGNTVLLQADVTANDAADQALLKRFDLFGPPAIVFFDRQGRHIPNALVAGYMPPDEFVAHVERVLGD